MVFIKVELNLITLTGMGEGMVRDTELHPQLWIAEDHHRKEEVRGVIRQQNIEPEDIKNHLICNWILGTC